MHAYEETPSLGQEHAGAEVKPQRPGIECSQKSESLVESAEGQVSPPLKAALVQPNKA